jgi:DsbC/DsbD-like thiol-disulfide interchange protein
MLAMREAIHIVIAALFVQAGGASLVPRNAAPKHLTLAASASASSATPGAKVSLFVDVTPNPGIHVYAPGATDFLPVALTIETIAGVSAGKVLYPKSDTMMFADEKVPVFQKPFRLAQEVTIARSAKPGTTLAISGVLRYQACDDAVCFIPASAPVNWTIAVK